METIDHFVEFDKYCETCKFRDKNDKKGEEPCNDCLDNPINQDSRKPVNYKEYPYKIERLEKEKKKKLKRRYFNKNIDYFKFCKKGTMKIYIVDTSNKSGKIVVYYGPKLGRPPKNKKN